MWKGGEKAFANGLEQVEKSVRCDKGVSGTQKGRKRVTMVDETNNVFWLRDAGTEENKGRWQSWEVPQ